MRQLADLAVAALDDFGKRLDAAELGDEPEQVLVAHGLHGVHLDHCTERGLAWEFARGLQT